MTCSYDFQGQPWDANETPKTAAFIGDSVLGSAGAIISALTKQRCHVPSIWAISGAAPCDFIGGYDAYLTEHNPGHIWRVSLAFVGNATSACMEASLGWSPPATLTQAQQNAIVHQYELDIRTLVQANLDHNARTYLILPPKMAAGTWHGQINDELVTMLTQVADAFGGVGIDSGPRDLLTPGGVYRSTIALNGTERRLRHTDGTHLAAPMGTWLYAAGAVVAPTLDA